MIAPAPPVGLVATDLDGTLLGSDHTLGPRDGAALRQLGRRRSDSRGRDRAVAPGGRTGARARLSHRLSRRVERSGDSRVAFAPAPPAAPVRSRGGRTRDPRPARARGRFHGPFAGAGRPPFPVRPCPRGEPGLRAARRPLRRVRDPVGGFGRRRDRAFRRGRASSSPSSVGTRRTSSIGRGPRSPGSRWCAAPLPWTVGPSGSRCAPPGSERRGRWPGSPPATASMRRAPPPSATTTTTARCSPGSANAFVVGNAPPELRERFRVVSPNDAGGFSEVVEALRRDGGGFARAAARAGT